MHEEKQAIVDVILAKKKDAVKHRREYESALHAKSAQERQSYLAGHREVWFRQDNLLEILMASLFGTCRHIYLFILFERFAWTRHTLLSLAKSITTCIASSTIYMFANMYEVAIKNPATIVDKNDIIKRFYDGEMRLDPDQSISANEVYEFLSDNEAIMKENKVIASPEGLQTWTGGLPHGDMEFLRESTAFLRRFDNSLGVGITYGLTVNE